jgi:hypothetical protein
MGQGEELTIVSHSSVPLQSDSETYVNCKSNLPICFVWMQTIKQTDKQTHSQRPCSQP